MKKYFYTSCLALLTIVLSAQPDQVSCYTILFTNNISTSVQLIAVDSLTLTFQNCDGKSKTNKKVSIQNIERIFDPSYTPDSVSLVIANYLRSELQRTSSNESQLTNPPSGNTWEFMHKEEKTFFSMHTGERVIVLFYDRNGKVKRVNGRLSDLTEENVIIDHQRKGTIKIPKEMVKKLKIYNKTKENFKRLGSFLLFIGLLIILTAFAIALPIEFGTGGEEDKGPVVASKIGLFLAFLSFIFLSLPPKKIPFPFSGNWEMVSPINKKADASEVNYRP